MANMKKLDNHNRKSMSNGRENEELTRPAIAQTKHHDH